MLTARFIISDYSSSMRKLTYCYLLFMFVRDITYY